MYLNLPTLIKVISPGKLENFLETGLILPYTQEVDVTDRKSKSAIISSQEKDVGSRDLRRDVLHGLLEALRVPDPPQQVTYILYQAVGRIYGLLPNTIEVSENYHVHTIFGSFGLSTKEPYTIMLVRRWHWHWHCCHLCTPPPGTGLDIETSYLVYICTFVPNICICPQYMHIKYLVILTCSFLMTAILVLFFDLLSCPYSLRDLIFHILMYLFFTFIHKRNNATGTFSSGIYEHFLKIH